ncbi:JM168 [macacine gammaherpesvirus 11]|uniref:JM168 n=2 Tax=macacine gammaherpesvirus 11 TaxID=2560570 RepID=G9JMZ5_9GAMA|nr:JM168 [Macaca fuscata rhadinovirus]AAT00145.1 JM168 [Macaca fuscata rhadinovirus]AEW87692.1 JM168 [Macaca fuscata rhadinovirus]AEW87862.1 JM168 [Macaca fuscata rhadinovirus]
MFVSFATMGNTYDFYNNNIMEWTLQNYTLNTANIYSNGILWICMVKFTNKHCKNNWIVVCNICRYVAILLLFIINRGNIYEEINCLFFVTALIGMYAVTEASTTSSLTMALAYSIITANTGIF